MLKQSRHDFCSRPFKCTLPCSRKSLRPTACLLLKQKVARHVRMVGFTNRSDNTALKKKRSSSPPHKALSISTWITQALKRPTWGDSFSSGDSGSEDDDDWYQELNDDGFDEFAKSPPPSGPGLTPRQRADLQAELAATSGLGAVSLFDDLKEMEREEARRELEQLQREGGDMDTLAAQLAADGYDLDADWRELDRSLSTTGRAKMGAGKGGPGARTTPMDVLYEPPSNPRLEASRREARQEVNRKRRRLFDTPTENTGIIGGYVTEVNTQPQEALRRQAELRGQKLRNLPKGVPGPPPEAPNSSRRSRASVDDALTEFFMKSLQKGYSVYQDKASGKIGLLRPKPLGAAETVQQSNISGQQAEQERAQQQVEWEEYRTEEKRARKASLDDLETLLVEQLGLVGETEQRGVAIKSARPDMTSSNKAASSSSGGSSSRAEDSSSKAKCAAVGREGEPRVPSAGQKKELQTASWGAEDSSEEVEEELDDFELAYKAALQAQARGGSSSNVKGVRGGGAGSERGVPGSDVLKPARPVRPTKPRSFPGQPQVGQPQQQESSTAAGTTSSGTGPSLAAKRSRKGGTRSMDSGGVDMGRGGGRESVDEEGELRSKRQEQEDFDLMDLLASKAQQRPSPVLSSLSRPAAPTRKSPKSSTRTPAQPSSSSKDGSKQGGTSMSITTSNNVTSRPIKASTSISISSRDGGVGEVDEEDEAETGLDLIQQLLQQQQQAPSTLQKPKPRQPPAPTQGSDVPNLIAAYASSRAAAPSAGAEDDFDTLFAQEVQRQQCKGASSSSSLPLKPNAPPARPEPPINSSISNSHSNANNSASRNSGSGVARPIPPLSRRPPRVMALRVQQDSGAGEQLPLGPSAPGGTKPPHQGTSFSNGQHPGSAKDRQQERMERREGHRDTSGSSWGGAGEATSSGAETSSGGTKHLFKHAWQLGPSTSRRQPEWSAEDHKQFWQCPSPYNLSTTTPHWRVLLEGLGVDVDKEAAAAPEGQDVAANTWKLAAPSATRAPTATTNKHNYGAGEGAKWNQAGSAAEEAAVTGAQSFAPLRAPRYWLQMLKERGVLMEGTIENRRVDTFEIVHVRRMPVGTEQQQATEQQPHPQQHELQAAPAKLEEQAQQHKSQAEAGNLEQQQQHETQAKAIDLDEQPQHETQAKAIDLEQQQQQQQQHQSKAPAEHHVLEQQQPAQADFESQHRQQQPAPADQEPQHEQQQPAQADQERQHEQQQPAPAHSETQHEQHEQQEQPQPASSSVPGTETLLIPQWSFRVSVPMLHRMGKRPAYSIWLPESCLTPDTVKAAKIHPSVKQAASKLKPKVVGDTQTRKEDYELFQKAQDLGWRIVMDMDSKQELKVQEVSKPPRASTKKTGSDSEAIQWKMVPVNKLDSGLLQSQSSQTTGSGLRAEELKVASTEARVVATEAAAATAGLQGGGQRGLSQAHEGQGGEGQQLGEQQNFVGQHEGQDSELQQQPQTFEPQHEAQDKGQQRGWQQILGQQDEGESLDSSSLSAGHRGRQDSFGQEEGVRNRVRKGKASNDDPECPKLSTVFSIFRVSANPKAPLSLAEIPLAYPPLSQTVLVPPPEGDPRLSQQQQGLPSPDAHDVATAHAMLGLVTTIVTVASQKEGPAATPPKSGSGIAPQALSAPAAAPESVRGEAAASPLSDAARVLCASAASETAQGDAAAPQTPHHQTHLTATLPPQTVTNLVEPVNRTKRPSLRRDVERPAEDLAVNAIRAAVAASAEQPVVCEVAVVSLGGVWVLLDVEVSRDVLADPDAQQQLLQQQQEQQQQQLQQLQQFEQEEQQQHPPELQEAQPPLLQQQEDSADASCLTAVRVIDDAASASGTHSLSILGYIDKSRLHPNLKRVHSLPEVIRPGDFMEAKLQGTVFATRLWHRDLVVAQLTCVDKEGLC